MKKLELKSKLWLASHGLAIPDFGSYLYTYLHVHLFGISHPYRQLCELVVNLWCNKFIVLYKFRLYRLNGGMLYCTQVYLKTSLNWWGEVSERQRERLIMKLIYRYNRSKITNATRPPLLLCQDSRERTRLGFLSL